MPAHSLHETTALTNYVQVCDQDGHLLLVPSVWIEQLATAGVEQIVATIRVPRPAGTWLTLTDAARRHIEGDVSPPVDADDAKRQLDAARKRLRRAVAAGEIVSDAEGRLNQTSLDAWRLSFRESDLDADI